MDGWWLDATEPEIVGNWGEYRTLHTAQGPGATVFKAFPLMTTTGIYQGQRARRVRRQQTPDASRKPEQRGRPVAPRCW
jgi:alpha-glucosidase (family GH31 glycosyl hydrolase)